MAVQACEAAAACISRPSSPQDTMPPPIPDRELAVRARLEDLIDQVLFMSKIIQRPQRKYIAIRDALEICDEQRNKMADEDFA